MKAPSSEENNEDGAEENEEIVFDYEDFFSVLMFYGHMSMDEIMNHSRAFLYGIYKMHSNRIKENLSIAYFTASKDDEEEEQQEEPQGQFELSASDYPTEFTKLPPKHVMESTVEGTREFLSGFGDAMEVFKNVQIVEDE